MASRVATRQHPHQQFSTHQPHHQPGLLSRVSRHSDVYGDKDVMRTSMQIPAIEITKDTPSESINPIESYSEEEFETSMRMRTGLGRGYGRGPSPVAPHRTRQISDYERSHLGRVDQMAGFRRGQGMHERIRWFVALFDYDPLTMSPNPDAADEELPFQEGQMIKVILILKNLILNVSFIL